MVATALAQRRREVTRAWERYINRGVLDQVRHEVASSWSRSAQRLSRDVEQAPLDPGSVDHAWRDSPLRTALAPISTEVAETAEQADMVAAITDARGRILWTSGSHHMRDRASTVNFVPGGLWDEASVGTNALDLALRTGRSASVFSAEHYSQCVHGWVCYAAPVRDPATGDVLGVLDFSSTWDRSHPLAQAAVTALARAMSQALTLPLPDPIPPDSRARTSDNPLALDVLGRPHLEQDGVPVMITQRQSEILLALAMHHRGLTLQELHAHVYGDLPVSLGTLKAEMSRLRRAVGHALRSRPYALTVPVTVDALTVLDHVRRADVVSAVRLYSSDVLPSSEAPVAVELRTRVALAVRQLVLTTRNTEAAVLLSERHPHDAEVIEHALRLLPTDAPRRALLEALHVAATAG
jgi:transcriptional regulator of acetoin/glycerol metabolism